MDASAGMSGSGASKSVEYGERTIMKLPLDARLLVPSAADAASVGDSTPPAAPLPLPLRLAAATAASAATSGDLAASPASALFAIAGATLLPLGLSAERGAPGTSTAALPSPATVEGTAAAGVVTVIVKLRRSASDGRRLLPAGCAAAAAGAVGDLARCAAAVGDFVRCAAAVGDRARSAAGGGERFGAGATMPVTCVAVEDAVDTVGRPARSSGGDVDAAPEGLAPACRGVRRACWGEGDRGASAAAADLSTLVPRGRGFEVERGGGGGGERNLPPRLMLMLPGLPDDVCTCCCSGEVCASVGVLAAGAGAPPGIGGVCGGRTDAGERPRLSRPAEEARALPRGAAAAVLVASDWCCGGWCCCAGTSTINDRRLLALTPRGKVAAACAGGNPNAVASAPEKLLLWRLRPDGKLEA